MLRSEWLLAGLSQCTREEARKAEVVRWSWNGFFCQPIKRPLDIVSGFLKQAEIREPSRDSHQNVEHLTS